MVGRKVIYSYSLNSLPEVLFKLKVVLGLLFSHLA